MEEQKSTKTSNVEVDSNAGLPVCYSAKFTGSYAYITVKDRLPVTLVKVIDTLCQDKQVLGVEHGEIGKADVKKAIGLLSALQNEMITNKSIKPLRSDGSDVALWNAYLERENAQNTFPAAWFESSWLYVECYLYRRIQEAFELSPVLRNYDPFYKQKEASVVYCMNDIINLCNKIHSTPILSESTDLYSFFKFYLEISLWGNKCDLSLFKVDEMDPQTVDVQELKNKILIDDTEKVWNYVTDSTKQGKVFDLHYVLDNYGFELFCDLCFLDFLLVSKLVNRVFIYTKKIPWFVSDTLEKDIYIMLDSLLKSKNGILEEFSKQWHLNLSTGKWKIEVEQFWTLPHDFSEMKTIDSNLYNKLSQGDLVIFKGDLNYRKLVGDRQWKEDIAFVTALNGFLPTSLLALRTIKADAIAGLEPGTSKKLSSVSENWKFTGQYALIQFASKDC